ncbi:hypothetical protein [Rhodobacter capsulatus]|uniref:hypothetical protein n=1 Tax=Rhodobacter capsulatus TaxID=1061 RepID=UPI0040266A7A
MTIIVLLKNDDKIHCFSDSRISKKTEDGTKKTTDKFSKIMLLPIHATKGKVNDGEVTSFRGEIGFAFCGDVVFATALYTMSSNMFLNLHYENANAAPSLKQLADGVSNLANILLDDYIFHARERDYQVALFGCCPATGELESYIIEFDKDAIPIRYTAKENPFFDGHPMALGSGSGYFYGAIVELLSKGEAPNIPKILLKGISKNCPDPAAGIESGGYAAAGV